MADKPSADIHNLRHARRARQRAEAQAAADANRAKHGVSRAARSLADARKAKAARDLDAHKRDQDDGSASES